MPETEGASGTVRPRVDADNVVGNVYDKYGTRNPIARAMMSGFLDAVTSLFDQAAPTSVLEVGCGEGRLAHHLVTRATRRPERFLASDVSLGNRAPDLDGGIEWREASIYELPFETNSFDLVVCCEVLEHLEHPAEGLAELSRVANEKVLLSTPWEPVWRALNMARGKYWRDLGNTPGHIQHFTRRGLLELARRQLDIRAVRRPLPWTVLLGDVRR